jgi:DNA-binding transcriptional LysR family regulator
MKSMGELKGKTIGVASLGGSVHLMTKELVAQNGLDPDRDVAIIVTGDPTGGWADYRDRLSDIGIATERLETVAGPTTLIAMVDAGLGVGLMGELATRVTLHGDLIARTLPAPIWRRDIHVSTSASRRLSPAASTFLDGLIAHCARSRLF